MRIYNGYPDEVHIDGTDTTLHDVNRMLLALMLDERLTDADKEYLTRLYRIERQRYLDAQYEMTETRRRVLQQIERKLADELHGCEARLNRLLQREREKKSQGLLRPAGYIHYHLEVANYAPEENESYSSEEVELWDSLFCENRLSWHWGLEWGTVAVDDGQQYRREGRVKTMRTADHASLRNLTAIKEKYHVAWQDIQKIKHFMLTVRLEY